MNHNAEVGLPASGLHTWLCFVEVCFQVIDRPRSAVQCFHCLRVTGSRFVPVLTGPCGHTLGRASGAICQLGSGDEGTSSWFIWLGLAVLLRHCRVQKFVADHCLMAADYSSALKLYQEACVMCRTLNDPKWEAGCLEVCPPPPQTHVPAWEGRQGAEAALVCSGTCGMQMWANGRPQSMGELVGVF